MGSVTMELVALTMEFVAVELELVVVTLLPGWMRMRMRPYCKADVLMGAELRIGFVIKMGSRILVCV